MSRQGVHQTHAGLAGTPTHVGADQEARGLEQSLQFWPGGLQRQHIQGGTGQASMPQRVGEGVEVHQSASGHVHQPGGGLHPAQTLAVDQILGLRRERRMQAEHIGLAQGGLQFIGGAAAGEGDALHAKGLTDRQHPPADVTRPQHHQGLPGQFVEFRFDHREHGAALPTALGQLPAALLHLAAEFKDQRPGDLHHRSAAVAAGVLHADAQLAAGLLIHLVGAGGGHTDQPQLGQLPQQRRIEADLVGDRNLSTLQALQPLLGGGGRPGFKPAPVAQRRQIHRPKAEGIEEHRPGQGCLARGLAG